MLHRSIHLLRLLAIAVLALGMLSLPATAQQTDPDPVDESSGAEDVDDDDEDEEDRGPRPNRGQGRLDSGEVHGHLAPAISQVGEQVTVHAVAQVHDHPGSGNGSPDGDGPGGPPEGVPAGPPTGDDEDAPADEEPQDAGDEQVVDTVQEDEDSLDEDGDEQDGVEQDGVEQDGDEAAEDDEAWKCTPVVDGGDDEAVVTEPDTTTDDGSLDTTQEDGTEVDDTTGDDTTGEESSDDETSDDETPLCDVTFTVDYGDGSAVEVMRPTKTRGADGSRRALAHHTYEAEGEYAVTITATPLEGEPTTIELVAQVGSGAARLDGDDRIATAVAISEDTFADDSADAVVLARADAFADALAASTLAYVTGAPVLLTGSEELPETVADEIFRVLADGGTVFVLGGVAAISEEVETALAADYQVTRLAEDDRIGTALAVAQHVIDLQATVDQVVVASAGDFPDALAGAAYAAADGGLILLTGTDVLDERVAAMLGSLAKPVVVAGGESAVSADVLTAIADIVGAENVQRIAGDTRFDTAVQLARSGYVDGDTVILATGTNYPDVLAGAVYAASLGAPVLLVDNAMEALPTAVAEFLVEYEATLDTVVALGGEGAVSDALIAAAVALVEPADATADSQP